jgi:hypothetical protein
MKSLPPSCAECPEALGASTSWNAKGMYRDIFIFLLSTVGQIDRRMPAIGYQGRARAKRVINDLNHIRETAG